MKYRASDKRPIWATYFSGAATATSGVFAKTCAQDLTVYNGISSSLEYAFVTGSTNCIDVIPITRPNTPFANAQADYNTGAGRSAWVGAFKKFNGWCDWYTTHGPTNTGTWTEDGLAIHVNDQGNLAVGGKLASSAEDATAFNLVTPAGAYSRTDGGGFVMTFGPNYTINWATTFADAGQQAQLTDLRFEGSGANTNLWVTGSGAVDVIQHPVSQFVQSTGSVFLGRFNVATHQHDFCTRWGGNNSSVAYGMDITSKDIYLVGYTQSTDLTVEQCPDPGGPTVTNTLTLQTAEPYQWSDGFIVRYTLAPFNLSYGTLIGGTRDDILLDVDASYGDIYITGETRSSTGFSSDLNSIWYYQPQYGVNQRRDAILLALSTDQSNPTITWRSILGGTESDRGWGIASSANEVYVVGGSASQDYQEFPLREFNFWDTYDYYQEYNLGGSALPFVDWYDFDFAMDFEHSGFGEWYTELPSYDYDGFIASFSKGGIPIGMDEPTIVDTDQLIIRPFSNGSEWSVQLPGNGTWDMKVHDASGKLISTFRAVNSTALLDLGTQATGMYFIRATNADGESRSAKVVKQ